MIMKGRASLRLPLGRCARARADGRGDATGVGDRIGAATTAATAGDASRSNDAESGHAAAPTAGALLHICSGTCRRRQRASPRRVRYLLRLRRRRNPRAPSFWTLSNPSHFRRPPPPPPAAPRRQERKTVAVPPAKTLTVDLQRTALPQDGRQLVEAFNKDRVDIVQEAERKLTERRTALIKELEALQEAHTKAGRLDDAVAIRDYLRTGLPSKDLVITDKAAWIRR